ncbi:unnamed protein product [Rotaria sp. Silwood1]|nr:unnamed protein product [Rotaria sp. Silwood1]CAF3813765.1 unnamed protein product [Rotaria sp. Silwood1]CAF4802845.1 unnamed protein product [Rotaria sp. Silwood1]CAF4967507.1 unnamed protein product [Rotaria sp. Silwood1]
MFTNTKLAEEIFSNQSADTQECLRQLPICAHANGHEQIYPVSTTFDKTIINDLPYLPQVDIPPDCRSLAKMLGVICDYDLRACVTVLQVLSDQRNTDLMLYIHWLGHLQLYFRQQCTRCQSIEVISSCRIYLPDNQQFRSLKDLLVLQNHTEHRTSIELVSEYLNLPVISPSTNQIYWQFKDLFDILNCVCAVNLSHLFQTIHLASCDKSNFHDLGDGMTVLKEMGVEKMISLYHHLETLILKCVMENKTNDTLHNAIAKKRHPTAPCGSREDWEWRFGLTCTKISVELRTLIGLNLENEQLPLLTTDRELVINTNGAIIYACMEQKIIENLAKDAGKRFFISPLITNTCPLVLAALNIDYVERRGSGASTKRCYFEVKGTGGSFNVQQTRFHISENERNTCETIAFNEQRKETEAYLVVIVEHCLDPEKIELAALINWSENFKLIHTSPDSHICYIVLPSPSDPKKTKELSADSQSSKPGPYIPPHRRK